MTIKSRIKSIAAGAAVKLLGLNDLARAFETGRDIDGNKNDLTQPYAQLELVYRCVDKLIDGIQGLPAIISTNDDRIVEGGPVYDLLFNDPRMSFERFITDSIGYYALTRDVFWIFTDIIGNRPREIRVVPGSQMRAITTNGRSSGMLAGWEFRGTGGERAEFDTSEVYQWRNFNPYDRFHGLGPLRAAHTSMRYSYSASLFNAASLENGAEPGIIIKSQGRMSPDDIKVLRSQFDGRHQGPHKAKRTAVITGGADIQTVAMKMVDMQVAELTQMSDAKICSAFGVPPAVVGLVTEAQYSHGPAQEDFAFNTLIPLARTFAGALTAGIIGKFGSDEAVSVRAKDSRILNCAAAGLSKNTAYRQANEKARKTGTNVYLWFDTDSHPTVQRVQREKTKEVLEHTKFGIPLNQIISINNLAYEPVEWGDDWWISMGLVPAKYAIEAGVEGLTGPSAPEGEGAEDENSEGKSVSEAAGLTANDIIKSASEQLKLLGAEEKTKAERNLRIWQNWVISWAGVDRQYREAMRKFFLRQQRVLTAKLKKAIGESKSVKADAGDIVARVVFDLTVENGKIKVINQTFFEKAAELGVRQALAEIAGVSGDELGKWAERVKLSPKIKAKLLVSSQRIQKTNTTTQQMIARHLTEGLEAGEGVDELAGRIARDLGSNRARALRIARTQTAGAVGTGRHEGMVAAGVELKSWVTSGDSEVRDAHRTAGIEYAAGIPVGEPFNVGGELLMYPADPSGSAANIINCRCLQTAVMAKGKALGGEYYSGIKFYSYEDMQRDKNA